MVALVCVALIGLASCAPVLEHINKAKCPNEPPNYSFRLPLGREPPGGWPAGTLLGCDQEKCEWIWADGKGSQVATNIPYPIIYNPPDMPGCQFKGVGANFCGTPFKD